MSSLVENGRKKLKFVHFPSFSRVLVFLLVLNLIYIPGSRANSANTITVLSSENITTSIDGTSLNIYLNTFRPNMSVGFVINLHNSDSATITTEKNSLVVPPNGSFQFTVDFKNSLQNSDLKTPLRSYSLDGTPQSRIQVFSTPPDFPTISFSGDTSLIKNKQVLSTPVVKEGNYAISSIGTSINFFTKSANNLLGFRRLTDNSAVPTPGGTPVYGYLEQKDFHVTATSPGIWRLLDSGFNTVSRINALKTKFGTVLPEGHGMTISPSGYPVVITTPTRNVNSNWLKRPFDRPILDCDIAEVHNGKSIREFSFWDWADKNRSLMEPFLDGMALFTDPQNPKATPYDICHANSLQYSNYLNAYEIGRAHV